MGAYSVEVGKINMWPCLYQSLAASTVFWTAEEFNIPHSHLPHQNILKVLKPDMICVLKATIVDQTTLKEFHTSVHASYVIHNSTLHCTVHTSYT